MTRKRFDRENKDVAIQFLAELVRKYVPAESRDEADKALGVLDDAFREWIRNNAELDSRKHGLCFIDTDLIVHKYKIGYDRCGTRNIQHLMLLEYKRFDGRLRFDQEDTLLAMHQLLVNAPSAPFRGKDEKPRSTKITTARGEKVTMKCWGVHSLVMSGSTPDDSTMMQWDRRIKINGWELGKLLRFEWHPYTLKPLHDRRHHVVRESPHRNEDP